MKGSRKIHNFFKRYISFNNITTQFSRQVFWAIFLVSLIFLSGCSASLMGGPGGTSQSGAPLASGSVYSGTRGLDLRIRDLPSEIYEGNSLNLFIEMWNRGVHDITNGRLYIGGFDSNIIKISGDSKPLNLEGKTTFNPEGSYDTVSFTSSQITLPEGTDVYNPTVVLSACYDYKTYANPVVCVDPAPYSQVKERACKAGTVEGLGGGQGAPVSVSSIRGSASPGKAMFRIDIANSGGGQVADTRYCPYELDYSNVNQVSYKVSLTGASSQPECQPSSPIKLDDQNSATIFCKFDVSGKEAYSTPLKIELDYGYMTSTKQRINIKDVS